MFNFVVFFSTDNFSKSRDQLVLQSSLGGDSRRSGGGRGAGRQEGSPAAIELRAWTAACTSGDRGFHVFNEDFV